MTATCSYISVQFAINFKAQHQLCTHLSAMTNPTRNETPDAGKNGTRIKVRAMPTPTRSLYQFDIQIFNMKEICLNYMQVTLKYQQATHFSDCNIWRPSSSRTP